jgi:hypothetical protein
MELKWVRSKSGRGSIHRAVLPVGPRALSSRRVEIYQAADLTCVLTFPSRFVRQHPNLDAAKADAQEWYLSSITDADGDRLVVSLQVGDHRVEVRQHPSKRFRVTCGGETVRDLDRLAAEAQIGAFVLTAADWEGRTE